jgi:hypothetical protein
MRRINPDNRILEYQRWSRDAAGQDICVTVPLLTRVVVKRAIAE